MRTSCRKEYNKAKQDLRRCATGISSCDRTPIYNMPFTYRYVPFYNTWYGGTKIIYSYTFSCIYLYLHNMVVPSAYTHGVEHD